MFKPIEDSIGSFKRESSPSPIFCSEKSNHNERLLFQQINYIWTENKKKAEKSGVAPKSRCSTLFFSKKRKIISQLYKEMFKKLPEYLLLVLYFTTNIIVNNENAKIPANIALIKA